ncbi:piggyBac transposable element-derived protein 3-like protein [Leptotrombidium deliense]|uniref:PiggyBac transposable element-derived protein 3-like protein n=1 Tax=Leptotrombidium deliense TaxID=299467 RepID=A0A443RWN1_9ACAR|nr:piggyBac transposable element-derived protein 3-like protein [Leptotrombidium deliense]
MGGVDLLNQMIAKYGISIKSRKWTLRVIFYFLDFAITNAWIHHREDSKANEMKPLDLLQYRIHIANSLCELNKKSVGRPKVTKEISSDTSETSDDDSSTHFPEQVVGRSSAMRCRYTGCKRATRN